MLQVKIINPLDDADWDLCLKAFPSATIFHSLAWAKVLVDSYGFVPLFLTAYHENEISGIIPIMEVRDIVGKKKGVCLPFTDFCGPLFTCQKDFAKTLDSLKELAAEQSWKFFDLRGGQGLLADQPFLEEIFTHDIDLCADENQLFATFRESTKRNIRNAKKNGVEVYHSNSIDALHAFYRLNSLTRRGHGIPPQPWKFFENLWRSLLNNNQGFLTIATFSGKAIAGDLFLLHDKKAIYKYGASDFAYQHLRPGNLAMWEGIRKCKESGCTSLNLGRTEVQHKGLLQFKRGFGCTETRVRYYRHDRAKNSFIQGGAAKSHRLRTAILSRLPIPALELLGRFLYRYSG